MVLNYIWIAFFLIAFAVALVRLVFLGDTQVFPEIINSTFSSSKTAFEISLGLTGVLSLWLGIMKIGEKGGARGNHLCVRVFQHDEGAAVALQGDDVVTGDIARLVQIQRELILGVERPAGRNRVRFGDNAANLCALLRAGAICQRCRGRNAQEQHHHAHHQCQHAGKQLLHGHKPVLLILHEPFSVLEVLLLRLRVEYNMAESDCQ